MRGQAVDFFNYVMVLSSVIIGLGLTHLLQGAAGIAQNPGREKIYWVHLVWVAAIFLRTVFWWWAEFQLSATAEWSFGLYCFVLGYAVLIYLSCALLFPHDLVDYDGFRDYFHSRKGWFFGVALASLVVDVADTLLKGVDHFRELGPGYPASMAVLAGLFVAAMLTRNERFHAALAVGTLGFLALYPVLNFNVMR